MDIDRYIARNEATWTRLDALTAQASRGIGRLRPADLDELVRLYERVSTHLSFARTAYGDPTLTAAVVHGTVADAAPDCSSPAHHPTAPAETTPEWPAGGAAGGQQPVEPGR